MALSNSLIGYGQNENNRLNRAYPSWMTGIDARGIGVANPFTAPAARFIDIPRGGDTPGFNQQPAYDPAQYASGYNAGRQPGPEGGAPSEAGNGMGNSGDGSFSDFTSDVSGLYGGVRDAMGSVGLGGTGMQIGSTAGSLFGPVGTVVGGLLGYGYDQFSGGGGEGGGGAPAGGPQQGGTGEMAAGTAEAAQTGGQYGMYRGGIVTHNRLTGPDPHGPDDGYAALDVGEGVLTAKAVKHYGKGLVNKLNRLAVDKGALR